jgi:hypothetical protein
VRSLIVSAEDDTGGVGVALAQALNRHTGWSARAVHRTQNYISYPVDIMWPLGLPPTDEILQLFADADVVHVMERWDAVTPFTGWQEKPLVLHHHGTIFREWNTAYLNHSAAQFGAAVVASTIDLTLLGPDIEWLPNPCDLARMRSFRAAAEEHDGLLAVHSPTNAPIKGTSYFTAAAAGAGWALDLVQWSDWESCLRRKARADLALDQLTFGYGLSGIEAMAMGIPVVGGCSDQRVTDLMLRSWGNLPFMLSTPWQLPWVMEFFKDPANRAASAAVGTWFVEQYHEESRVAAQAVRVYERAMAMRHG